jgi:5-formyltetrahydrofolate cyclo-ligase
LVARVDIDEAKQRVRERIWALLEREAAAPAGVYGRIPAFFGAQAAADRLAMLAVWQAARTVKAVPDKAQLPVRVRALTEGKLVYMAVPRLAHALPFFLLDPASLTVSPEEAASSHVAETVARKVGVEDMQPVDLVICGSVAVNRRGVRLGKGAGYSDIELALLQEAGLLRPETKIVTTVHPLQVVNESLPETGHDFSVDLIVTPDEVIECDSPRRPSGLLWEDLDRDKVAGIPVLATRAAKQGRPLVS